MEERCDWCFDTSIRNGLENVYWELPDGTRAIEISETPTCICSGCGMVYQKDTIVKQIEDQLFLVDTKKIGKSITYTELLRLPRLLKRNYFDFS